MSSRDGFHGIRFGCQTYTWQMSMPRYAGRVEHIVATIRSAGLEGIEPETCMLGGYAEDPARLRDVLAGQQIRLGALCLVADWRAPSESPAEQAGADAAIAMLREYFPDCVLALCQMPGIDRTALTERRRNAIACIDAVARRAAAAGIVAGFHPNSPSGSVFRTPEDYAVLLDSLDPGHLGFIPDAGHLAKGGMDPVKVIRESIALVKHVHLKDMNDSGAWVEMGRGIIDFPGIIRVLADADYHGWVMVEDESELAERDPDAATIANGAYVNSVLRTIIQEKKS
jgi:inosose dehydratase